MTGENQTFYPHPKNVSSPMWEFFGFCKKVEVLETPVFKKCLSTVILKTLQLKPLCITHFKRTHNVCCHAFYFFINNCKVPFYQRYNALYYYFLILLLHLKQVVCICFNKIFLTKVNRKYNYYNVIYLWLYNILYVCTIRYITRHNKLINSFIMHYI